MFKLFAYRLISIIVILVSVYSGSAQLKSNKQIRLNVLTTNDGLSQNTVDCILKDSKGFMWFGTWNGLCRFDGYSFKIFQKQNKKGLNGNMIQALCEDSDGNIWVGTENGLAFFSYNSFEFLPIEKLNEQINNSSVTSICADSLGTIWIGTEENGLWEIRNDNPEKLSGTKKYSNYLPSESINHLLINPENQLFIGTDRGLCVIDLDKEELASEYSSLINDIGGASIQITFQDSRNNLWLGTSDVGLYHYNTEILNLNYFGASTISDTSLNHLAVLDIIEDQNETIIIGTLGGLNFFNAKTNTFSHLSDAESLSSPFVNSLYADNNGNIWIGTEKGGVDYYNTFQKPFRSIKHNPAKPNSISHNTINSLLIENETMWIGTAGGGLNKVSGSNIKTFNYNPNNPAGLNNDFVSSLYRDIQNNLWVGVWGGGLSRLISANQNSFETLVNEPANPASLCNSFVSCIEPLNNQQLLIGTAGGLDIFTLESRTFLHIHEKMNLNNDFSVGCLLVDKSNHVWVGTENGLFRFNKDDLENITTESENIKFEKFIHQQNSPTSLPGNYIISLLETHDGSIWVGTYGNGICKYMEDNSVEKFINYTEEHGLCNNVAYGIEEDKLGHLWISTDNGLSQFNPKTKTFQNYFESDGLLSNQFYWSASYADDNGNLFFGGIEGLNYFSPSQIESYPHIPKPVFTELLINSNPVIIGEKFHSQIILNKPISLTEKIELSYKDAVFSIEFAALDYFLPEKIKYAYQMEGVDQDWVEVSASRRFANYTNLSGGEYIFKVKATNSDGNWNQTPATLTITVKPPYWETAWFQILAVLFIAALVAFYIRSRTRFLKEQKRKLEQQVRERTQQIEAQKQELEKQNIQISKQRDEVIELNEKVKLVNQLRLRFFTNISHEFRTPLTLIIDPLEQLMQKLKSDKNTHNTLGIINRNAQRLLHLINQLLYFRRIETGKLKLNVSKGNLTQFIHGIFESFKDLAEHQQVSYQFNATETKEETWFDSEKVENVFYNLLSNAFKNTSASGSVHLNVDFINAGKPGCLKAPFVEISVIDSGKGISKEHLPHIFDRFYKTAEDNTDTDFTSSGIGLALTHEIVKALHGEIKVNSKPREGSSFTVCMPYAKERFSDHEINENTFPAGINLEGRVNVLSDQIIAANKNFEAETETQDDKLKPAILIVEDNFDLRSFLLQTLRTDYRVIGAENGKIGLEMAKKYSPELIISDVMMPEMDGIELCSQLKKNIQTSHIPLILLTAKNMFESWIEGLETGADDYIPKPFNLKILQVKMRNLIESRRKIKRMFSSPEPITADELPPNKLDGEFISKAYKILEENYTESDFSVEQFAKDMFVSQSLLYKKIKALTDLSITDFVNSFKLKKSVEQIKTTNQPISEIAFNCGFNDPKYFSRIFKKFYGMSPSKFQEKNTPR